MTKSMNRLMMLGVCGLLAVTTTATAEAGIIPWTYNAIFGPVGSTFAARPTYGYGANYGASYGGNACCGTTNNCGGNACCGTTSNYYSAGYAPYTTSYAPYYAGYTPYYAGYSAYGSCSSCGTCNNGCSSCNSCGYGCATNGCSNCASGDCNSGLTPAAGTTSTPETNNSPTPTTTFKSTEPTVNPNAGEKPNYDEPSNNSNGFEMPEREKKTDDTNAPPFNFNSSRDALKVPSAPMVPVEQMNPEPTQLEEFRAPRLDLIPAPVAVDDSQISWSVTSTPTRVVRNARYSIPTVARYTPAQLNELVPPMPIQVAEK